MLIDGVPFGEAGHIDDSMQAYFIFLQIFQYFLSKLEPIHYFV